MCVDLNGTRHHLYPLVILGKTLSFDSHQQYLTVKIMWNRAQFQPHLFISIFILETATYGALLYYSTVVYLHYVIHTHTLTL